MLVYRLAGSLTADIYYDRSLRLWVLIWKDQNCNQVGEADYYPRKDLALQRAENGFDQ